ncbi:MAG: hypothetical protein WCA79_00285 [Anaerolineales bacterium]
MFSSSKSKKIEGQGLVEYALILVLVAIVVIAVLMVLGPGIGSIFSNINSSMPGIAGGSGTGVTSASQAPLCAHWGRTSPATVSGGTNGVVLITTTVSPIITTTLNANDPAMTTPGSQYYNPIVLDTLPAGVTVTCP